MRPLCRTGLAVAGFGLLTLATGCQTQLAGLTLPSGYYLHHRPQYFPPEPSFPLSRELATMQAQNAAIAAAESGQAGKLPAPVAGAK